MPGIDISALTASLGAYHREKASELYSKLLEKEYSMSLFSTIAGIKDEYIITETEVSEILQPYQKAWTPKGDIKFVPETLKVRRIKVDLPLDPIDLERSWEGKRIDGSLPEGQELLEGYILSEVIKRIKKDLEFRLLFNGEYVAPTPGTPGGASTSFDGLLKIVSDAITAAKIVPVATGVLSQTNARESFEMVFDAVDSDYQTEQLVALCSPTLLRWYKRDYRAEFGNHQDYRGITGELQSVTIDGTNTEIVGCPGMAGSQRIVITKKENLKRLIDGTSEDSDFNLRFQVNRREIEVLGDFKMGVGMPIIKGLVWTNDQE
ncbi:hypothetical protein [Chitinophaga rhizosphaerae]|uniref:hypothetical protein n=1 Tax=Chitinophaga rhizosphaerae TaxID=1864947 RepID=UPI000F801AB5|nr:hypothetical protein [Chitinophaga rhizosphaerae]